MTYGHSSDDFETHGDRGWCLTARGHEQFGSRQLPWLLVGNCNEKGFVWDIWKKIAHVESMTFYYGWNVGEYRVFDMI